MKKISSNSTFFNKRIFPTIWFGFLGVFFLTSLLGHSNGNGPDIMFLVMPIFMAIFGFFIMKFLVFDMIDEVFDEGTSLLFRNGKKEVRVDLRDVKNVSYITFMNPPRVTISLRTNTELGNELTFSPPRSLIPFKKNRDIEELIDRIDRMRS